MSWSGGLSRVMKKRLTFQLQSLLRSAVKVRVSLIDIEGNELWYVERPTADLRKGDVLTLTFDLSTAEVS